jgi:hypothetical protein
MSKITELLSKEEIMAKQRSRIAWLKDGDRNIKLFQAKSREHAYTNRITALRAPDGELRTDQEELEGLATAFYKELFMAQAEAAPEEVLAHVPARVSSEMNEALDRPYTAQEVEWALFMMEACKALGPNGFTTGFFEWRVVVGRHESDNYCAHSKNQASTGSQKL